MAETTRRAALKALAAGGAGVVAAPLWVEHLLAIADQHAAHRARATASAPAAAWSPKVLNAHQNELVTTASELIIPTTGTPGATAAQVNRYIDDVLADAAPADRDSFLQGLAWLDMRSEQRFNRQFANATPDQQIELLQSLDTAASLEPPSRPPLTAVSTGPELVGAQASTAPPPPSRIPPEDRPGVDAYRALKAMTCAGYYSSEIGVMQEIGHDGQMFFTEFKGCTHPEHGGS